MQPTRRAAFAEEWSRDDGGRGDCVARMVSGSDDVTCVDPCTVRWCASTPSRRTARRRRTDLGKRAKLDR